MTGRSRHAGGATATPPEMAIHRWLARRTHATASQIAAACAMGPGVACARLVVMESMRLVVGRSDPDAPRDRPRRIYAVTAEGRRRAGINDARG